MEPSHYDEVPRNIQEELVPDVITESKWSSWWNQARKTLKTDPNLSDIPVLMVTTENDVTEKERAFHFGADGYVVKPVTGDAIAENIKNILKELFTKGGQL